MGVGTGSCWSECCKNKMKKTKVSILYSKTGGGHLSLALGTAEALEEYYPGQFTVELFDPLPEMHSKIYEKLGRDWQNLWGFSYKATAHPRTAQLIHHINSITVQGKLSSHFASFKPNLVISNHPFITAELSAYKKPIHHFKKIIHFADPFSLHPAWFTFRNADLYLSPTVQATKSAVKHKIPPNKIRTVGWLTRSRFFKVISSAETTKSTLGLSNNKFTVFIGGSGQGGGKLYELCLAISASKILQQRCQFIVNTGHNPILVKKVTEVAKHFPFTFFVIPYTTNIASLMNSCDMVIGKAGPNFLFESLHLKKPFLATGCLPGQEEGNLTFIKKQNVGWVIEDPYKAIKMLEKIMSHSQLLKIKIKNIKKTIKPHRKSGLSIANEIVKLRGFLAKEWSNESYRCRSI